MAADLDRRAEIGGATLDHAPGINPVHRLLGQCAGASHGGAEEGGLATVANARSAYIGVEIGFQIVMRRHLMPFAAFFMQAHPPAFAFGVVILDAHGDDGHTMRAKANVITEISARSRSPTTVEMSILSSNSRQRGARIRLWRKGSA
jgi:hypothetical protein